VQSVSSPVWPRTWPPACSEGVALPATLTTPELASGKPPPATAVTDPPNWVSEVRRKYRLRITDWAVQSWAMTIAPRRFMGEWATGQREALNPLRFLAVGTALEIVAERVSRWYLHLPRPDTTWVGWITSSFGMTVFIVLMAAIMHGVLRLKSRAPLRSSIAATIFSTSGPGTLLCLLSWGGACAYYAVFKRISVISSAGLTFPWPVYLASMAPFFAWTVAALTGVHAVRWWWGLLAVLAVPIVIMAVSIAMVIALFLTHHEHLLTNLPI
jgi:hypothetical protein